MTVAVSDKGLRFRSEFLLALLAEEVVEMAVLLVTVISRGRIHLHATDGIDGTIGRWRVGHWSEFLTRCRSAVESN